MARARSLVPLLAVFVLAAPATAGGRLIQTIPLDAPSDGVAIADDGTVHVIEPATQTDAIFGLDGTLIKRVTLPGPAGTAHAAALAPDGLVWVAIGSRDASRGFAELDGTGLVRTISTASTFTCPPAEMAPDYRDGPMFYTAVDPGDGAPCTGGVGLVMADGTELATQTGPATGGVASYDYDAFVPWSGDQVKFLNGGFGSFGSFGQIAFPAGSEPTDLADGLDGMFVTLRGTGQLAVFGPDPYSDRTFAIAASGIEGPRGLIQSNRESMLVAAHDGDRLVEVPELGYEGEGTATPTDIPLPPGFHPDRLFTGVRLYPGAKGADDDVWVTDDETAQVARIVDGTPHATITGATATSLDFDLDTDGNDTRYSVVVTRSDGSFVEETPTTPVAANLALQHVHAGLPALATGTYTFQLRLSNGGDYENATLSVTGASTQAPPSTPGGQPTPKPTVTTPRATTPIKHAPKATDLITLAAPTRCVANRRLRLALVAHPKTTKAKVVSVSVKVGNRRARTYTAKRLKAGVALTGLPKGRYALKIVVGLSDRTKATLTRTYRACKAQH
ncbi:MAG TPA: hypothetical protein VI318_06185 [Baekduia sp.]